MKYVIQLTLLILLKLGESAHSAKILGIFPFGLKSHYIIFDSLMVELARRGHNVTVINTFPKSEAIPNYTEVDVRECFQVPKERFSVDIAFSYQEIYPLLREMFSFVKVFDKILDCGPMRDLIRSDQTYDLLLIELFSSDVTLGYAHKFRAPFISLCANTLYPWASDRVANPDNPSYIVFNHNNNPIDLNRPSFFQRLYNTYGYLLAVAMHKYYSESTSDAIVKKYFGPSTPSVTEIARNTSLVMTYSHFSVNSPKPLVPAVVEIGGIQINEPKPLPEDIEKFINESENGVVYFCLGSLLQAETLPEAKRMAFMHAFSKIPQRVLWKWEQDILEGNSGNILTRKWMPQRDILAHPKVKLFITHGGALGVNEAIHEGVPLLGIPIFGDQKINLRAVQSAGAGDILEYDQISNETVLTKIRNIVQNAMYKENAKELSRRYKDRPMTPLETAVYWTEYVIRHNGASHLKSPALNLYWYQYYFLDIVSFCVVFFGGLLVLTLQISKFLVK